MPTTACLSWTGLLARFKLSQWGENGVSDEMGFLYNSASEWSAPGRMSDPFLPSNSESQLIREAKIGFSIVLIVVFALGCWGVFQYQKFQNRIPTHVRNAPVARHVGPEEYLKHLDSPATDVLVNASIQDEPVSAAPAIRLANNTASAAPKQRRDLTAKRSVADQVVSGKSIDSAEVIQRLNDNIDQLSLIANSFAPRDVQSEPPKFIANSINPIAPPAARDLSNDLPGFQQPDDNDLTGKRPSAIKLVDSPVFDPKTDETNRFQPQENQRDVRVKPVNFEENNSAEPVPEKVVSYSRDSTSPAPFDENMTLEVVDPQTAPEASSQQTAAEDDELHYRTVKGDSFWSIAQQKYGDGRYFSALFQHNRHTVENFDELPPNSRIMTPTIGVLRSHYPQLCPNLPAKSSEDGQNYTTVAGDTLFHIARQTTGQASRYMDLLKLNRDRLPIGTNHLTRLQANLELRLPN